MIEHLARFLVAVFRDNNTPVDTRLRAVELLLELAKRDPQTVGMVWATDG